MANDIFPLLKIKIIISLLLAFLISLATVQSAHASTPLYDLNYAAITRHLLVIKGTRTTNRDLHYLSCIARTHLERNQNALEIFNYRSSKLYFPTNEQIDIVKNVINNKDIECYDLYMVLPLDLLSDSSLHHNRIATIVCNDLVFISYRTFVLLTVSPNL